MVSGTWVIKPAFLELGKVADRKVPDMVGKGTEVNQITMALTIINSLYWKEINETNQLIYPDETHFETEDFNEEQAEILSEIISENITPNWVEKNIRTTILPNLAWGGNPDTIREAAKDYLQYGIDSNRFKIMSKRFDNDVIEHKRSGFCYPIFGFVNFLTPHSINRKDVVELL